MQFIEELKSDKRVDNFTLMDKIDHINGLIKKKKFDAVQDFYAELWGAYHLIKVPLISNIKFSETPDIVFHFKDGSEWGLEVKRIRKKDEDDKDESRMLNSFVRYGKPRYENLPWAEYVKENIIAKAHKNYSTGQNLFLFLKSDSPFQIERAEIFDGIHRAYKFLPDSNPFIAVFYETFWQDNKPLHCTILRPKVIDPHFLESLEHSNYFSINNLDID